MVCCQRVVDDFSFQSLPDADFGNANLQKANFRFAYLHKASFVGADLLDADFTGADLREADFTGARTSGIDLTDADIDGCTLEPEFEVTLTQSQIIYTKAKDQEEAKSLVLSEVGKKGWFVKGVYLANAKSKTKPKLPSWQVLLGFKKKVRLLADNEEEAKRYAFAQYDPIWNVEEIEHVGGIL